MTSQRCCSLPSRWCAKNPSSQDRCVRGSRTAPPPVIDARSVADGARSGLVHAVTHREVCILPDRDPLFERCSGSATALDESAR
eukprot:1998416-Prymnesium_polylepis.1